MHRWDGRPFQSAGSFYHCVGSRPHMHHHCHHCSRCRKRHDDRCEARTITRRNDDPISIPESGGNGIANPYPSPIQIWGLEGCIQCVTVKLHNFSHESVQQVSMLLVPPEGPPIHLMGAAGGDNEVNDVELTFDDCARNFLPQDTAFNSGKYKPTVYYSDFRDFDDPAPDQPYVNTLCALEGKDPNGEWLLYIDDTPEFGDIESTGIIEGGWSLTITTKCDCKKCKCHPR